MNKSTKIGIAILVAIGLAYGIGMLFAASTAPETSGPATSSEVPGQNIPDISTSGYVNDGAEIMSPGEEAVLATKLGAYSGEMAVVTVKSLNGLLIEELGIRIGEKWKVGRAGKDDGIIVIVALDDRKVRIEVGRGANVTDSQAQQILDSVMVPKLKVGEWSGAINDGVDALIKLTSN